MSNSDFTVIPVVRFTKIRHCSYKYTLPVTNIQTCLDMDLRLSHTFTLSNWFIGSSMHAESLPVRQSEVSVWGQHRRGSWAADDMSKVYAVTQQAVTTTNEIFLKG